MYNNCHCRTPSYLPQPIPWPTGTGNTTGCSAWRWLTLVTNDISILEPAKSPRERDQGGSQDCPQEEWKKSEHHPGFHLEPNQLRERNQSSISTLWLEKELLDFSSNKDQITQFQAKSQNQSPIRIGKKVSPFRWSCKAWWADADQTKLSQLTLTTLSHSLSFLHRHYLGGNHA